jgi:hypothetical protein
LDASLAHMLQVAPPCYPDPFGGLNVLWLWDFD